MRTIEYLTDPRLRGLFLPGVLAAIAIACMTGPFSVLVVLRRMAFIGQGISHAAFGGVGIALLLGLTTVGISGFLLDGVVLAFAIAAAMLIAWMSARGRGEVDTAIGIVLAVCMAAGFVLHGFAAEQAAGRGEVPPPSLESILFGSMLGTGWVDAATAWGAALYTVGLMAWFRRPLVFWAFDDGVAVVHGVNASGMRQLTLVLLALIVITTMKLAGIVLATAMLVLPGAAACRVARAWGLRLGGTLVCSSVVAMVGVVAGVVLSFETDLQTGPSIVAVLAVVYGASLAWPHRLRSDDEHAAA
ncbi:MAG: metal ABC transporter permease [Planctomycetota bacterium]